MVGTLTNYFKGAVLWFEKALGLSVPCVDPSTTKLLPNIADHFNHQRKWQRPRSKRNPYTQEMYECLHRRVVSACKLSPSAACNCTAAVFDWARLGIFTGSRGNEYVQTTAKRHCFSTVPHTPAAGSFAGQAVAFIASDFTFYDISDHLIVHSNLPRARTLAVAVHICFRFDKSPRNFTVRKFARSSHEFLCPVDAAINIICRALFFAITATEPLAVCAFTPTKSWSRPYTYLRSKDMIRVMRSVVIEAYPDPSHYMRLDINSIDCHSNRVTAALALHLAGLSDENIAFKLRWSPESVKHYIRDCNKHIGHATLSVIRGHFLL